MSNPEYNAIMAGLNKANEGIAALHEQFGRLHERQGNTERRLDAVENNISRVVWGILGFVGVLSAGGIVWAVQASQLAGQISSRTH